MEEVDFLVVGQGIAGSVLAMRLLEYNQKILVYDKPLPGASSVVSAGLINPLSGRKATLSWNFPAFWAEAQLFYKRFEQFLGVKFFFPKSLFRPFATPAAQNDILAETAKWPEFFDCQGVAGLEHIVYAPYGGLRVKASAFVHWPVLLERFRAYLRERAMLKEEIFESGQLKIKKEYVDYQGVRAKGVVFCLGHFALHDPLFSWLQLRPAKGEILDVQFDTDIPCIINKNGWILPVSQGICRAGATFWPTDEPSVSPEAIPAITKKIESMVRTPYKILGVKAGVRPTTPDRKPIWGSHPKHRNILFFNGLGSRGTAIAPLASLWLLELITKIKN